MDSWLLVSTFYSHSPLNHGRKQKRPPGCAVVPQQQDQAGLCGLCEALGGHGFSAFKDW